MRKAAAVMAMLLVAACGEPSVLSPPAGAPLLFEFTARGTNTYFCRGGTGVKWTLQEKSDETLYDSQDRPAGQAVATPYSTRWQASDGSVLTAQAVAREDTFHGDELPSMLFGVTSRQGTGLLSKAQTVRRVRSRGGVPPAGECKQPGVELKRPYSVVYEFYGAGEAR